MWRTTKPCGESLNGTELRSNVRCDLEGASMRLTTRVGLGVFAVGFVLWPAIAAAQDDAGDEPDPAGIQESLDFYLADLLTLDFDDDGVPDIFSVDGVLYVSEPPVGDPGEFDLKPGDGIFGTQVSDVLSEDGYFDSVGDSSTLIGDCGGVAMSFDDNGAMIDMAIGVPSKEGGGPDGTLVDVMPGASDFGARAFTSGNPFEVHVQGKVVYYGTLPRSGDGAEHHLWYIKTAGISLDAGGDPNPRLKNRNAGLVDLGKEIGSLLQFTGDFDMEAKLTSLNGRSCDATGHIRFVGPFPPFTLVGGIGSFLGAMGIFGLLFNSRPAITWRA